MLLQGYKKEMFLPKCNPSFQSVHCVAHLDQDISEALPYLNTELGGGDYIQSPPSLTLRVHGKLITLHAREIYVNALNGEEEAEKIEHGKVHDNHRCQRVEAQNRKDLCRRPCQQIVHDHCTDEQNRDEAVEWSNASEKIDHVGRGYHQGEQFKSPSHDRQANEQDQQ